MLSSNFAKKIQESGKTKNAAPKSALGRKNAAPKSALGRKNAERAAARPERNANKKAAAGKRLAAAAEKPEMEGKRAYCTRTTSSPCFTAPVAMASTEA
jgi:hypothetical protein